MSIRILARYIAKLPANGFIPSLPSRHFLAIVTVFGGRNTPQITPISTIHAGIPCETFSVARDGRDSSEYLPVLDLLE